jgi:hypothetical protein
VRRILASLLVVLVGFSLIPAAAFASNAESKVPACCRRDGKHHCHFWKRIQGIVHDPQHRPVIRSVGEAAGGYVGLVANRADGR